MRPLVPVAALPLMLLAPAAEGQEPKQPDQEAPHLCAGSISVDLPDRSVRLPSVAQPSTGITTIDVMVVMSPKRAKDRPDHSARAWIETANEMHRMSRSPVRLRFVGWFVASGDTARRMEEFERGGALLGASREGLLHAMARESDRDRRRVGADVVVGVGAAPSGSQYGGWAFEYANRAHAMAFVFDYRGSRLASSRNFTARVIAHEIGHVLGLGHHDGAGSYVSYGRGYIGASHDTIMADRNVRNIAHVFSSTGETDWGYGFGDREHDSVRAMRLTASRVAGYERTRVGNPPPREDPPPDDDPPPSDDDDDDDDRPTTGGCTASRTGKPIDCHRTALGDIFAVQFFHENQWKWARIAHAAGDSAVFHFFGADNLEVFAKVLNGCAIDGSLWVYGSGLTDLPVDLSVRHDQTGEVKHFRLPDGGVLRPQNGGRLKWCSR